MKNEIAIITGSTRGIGKAMLNHLIERGIPVFSINKSLQETLDPDLHHNFTYDLKAIDQLDRLVKEILQTLDLASLEKIYLYNNAAMLGPLGPLNDAPVKELKETFFVNLISPILLSKHMISALQSQHISLEIVNISSGAAFHPLDGLGPYCISKAGLEMASSVLHTENKDTFVRSVTIGPGVVDTQMQDKLRSSNPEAFASHELFVSFQKKGLLAPVDDVGKKIIDFILKGEYEGGRYYEINEI